MRLRDVMSMASRPIRGASAVFLTRDGERWPVSKVQDTHPRLRRPKPHGPDALSCASPEAIGRTRAAPSQRRRAGVPHQRWTRSREGPEKGESTGGFVEQASNIACGTSGDDEPAVTDYPDRLRAVRRAGSVGSLEPDVPRALGSFRDAHFTDAAPGRANQSGWRSVGCLTSKSEASDEARTRSAEGAAHHVSANRHARRAWSPVRLA